MSLEFWVCCSHPYLLFLPQRPILWGTLSVSSLALPQSGTPCVLPVSQPSVISLISSKEMSINIYLLCELYCLFLFCIPHLEWSSWHCNRQHSLKKLYKNNLKKYYFREGPIMNIIAAIHQEIVSFYWVIASCDPSAAIPWDDTVITNCHCRGT